MGTSALVIRRFLLFLSMVIHGIRVLFASDTHLHRARFANTSELSQLLTPTPPADGLLLGRAYLRSFVTVRPQHTRRELGNLLIVGPTRSGKGLLSNQSTPLLAA